MASVGPRGRKHLSADALFRLVRSGFATIPDYRLSETDISLTNALMSAFAMFSLTSPSLLAFDKERVEGNGHRGAKGLHHATAVAVRPCQLAHERTEPWPIPRGMRGRDVRLTPVPTRLTPALMQHPVRHLQRDRGKLDHLGGCPRINVYSLLIAR